MNQINTHKKGKRMRSRDQVRAIDSYIKANYPTDGADIVARALGEDRTYIMNRAHLMKVRMLTPKRKEEPIRKSKNQIIQELKMNNMELRRQLIKQTHQVHELKKLAFSTPWLEEDYREPENEYEDEMGGE